MKIKTPPFPLLSIAFVILIVSALAIISFAPLSSVEAQSSCENIPQGSGESISANISVRDTGQPVSPNGLVPGYTNVNINAVATAFGQCIGMGWDCSPSPCVCTENGFIYERTVSHISVYVDVSTATGLNGTYFVGSVFGRNPNGTTADFHVLDTGASNTTGPLHFMPSHPGTYTFRIKAIINKTPCNIEPGQTNQISITLYVGPDDDATTNAEPSCESNVGEPVNVTTGNMYLKQTDYRLPGFGEGLDITRTYNSAKQTSGLFGVGWSSMLDESIVAYGNLLVRLNMPDGRAVYFARNSVNAPFDPVIAMGFHGQVVKNIDNSYTLTLRDGSVHQFNANGKLTSLTDPNGNTITLTLNASGNPTTITDASGRTVSLTYDSQSKIASISDSLGTIATYTRLSFGRLSSVTYGDGSKFNFTYVISGNNIYLATVKDALNNVLESHTYDSQGRALTSERAGNGTERYTLTYVNGGETHVTDALNHVTKYFFDTSKGRNVVTSVEGSCGCGNSPVTQWIYDNQLNLISKTDALNHATTYTYDANGNRLTQTDATGTITYTYNSLGQVLTMTDQMSGVWTNTYDAQGNLLTTKDPLNNTTTFTYNSQGKLLSITDPRNNTTTLTYNSNGNLAQRTDALNNQTNLAYDSRSRVTSVTNALNETTSFEYDLAGRLKKTIYPDTNFVLFTYDLAGRRTKAKDPRGYETTFGYDAAYRLTSETNADNKTTTYAYDLMSNLTGVTDQLNRTTNYSYDDFNRLTKIKYPEPTPGAGRPEENLSYDLVGNLVTKTDQAGRTTSYCYDNADRLTSVIDPDQKTTVFEFNARSQMTALVDAINQRYEFVYDPLGRTTQEKKGTATQNFVYDAAGNRTQRTDFNASITNYTYDALNRRTAISYPDTTSATYGYDVLSRLTTATNPAGTVTVAYDNGGRVSSVTDVFGQVLGYAYDANSNRTQSSLNATTSAAYQYDVINRLTQLTDAGGLNTTFIHDAGNKLVSRTLPNGVVSTYEYDGLNRLKRLKHVKGANTLADFQYQFNIANKITQSTDGAGAHTYTYDPLDRLISATHPAGQTNESYTYDAVGNRTASHEGPSFTYQTFNRLVAANGKSFGYDTNGNQISKTDAQGTWSYTWDYENRLQQATLQGGVSVTYVYDALGRRVMQTSSLSGVTKFVYDGPDVIQDLDASNSPTATYLNDLSIDSKLRITVGQTISYFLQDHLKSTRALADAAGNIVATQSYDSFGNPGGTISTRYQYTGRELDSEIGLHYYRARFYDSRQGRFTREDPIGFRGGLNFYSYVENDPLNYVDPQGTSAAGVIAIVVTAAEAGLHYYLFRRAMNLYPPEGTDDPYGRKKHCYVTCMSTRIHLMNPVIPNAIGGGKEAVDLLFGFSGPGDAIRDIASNSYGSGGSWMLWRSCKAICDGCPF